uniref:One-helix protein 2 n=1 Tax=Kalanchoe fedtschenkoi TaxID=63787 RepID=A0A7N1A624_KALFE
MSVASSIPSIKPPTCPSTSPASSSSPSTFRCFSATTIRGSQQADGPIRRPVAPPLRQPAASPPQPAPPAPKPAAVAAVDKGVVTLEFQRQMAKELQEYFKQKKLEEADVGPFFGFLAKNEISNGRWAMFGFAVGMLTEYATGSDFVEQVKILFSNFGILDLD